MGKINLLQALNSRTTERKTAEGDCYRTLMFADEKILAETCSCTHYQVQMCALENGIVPERYIRNQKTFSSEDQLRLLDAHVVVAGLGGLGGAVVEMLARAGVGRLTLIDGDRFEDSNLNRQLLSSVTDLGRSKADVAARRVTEVNPAVETSKYPVFLNQDNCRDLIGDADIVVDCLDTIPVRLVLQQGCADAGTIMVSAAVAGCSGQAMVVYPGESGLRQVYNVSGDAPQKGAEAVWGTMVYTAVAMASVQCALTVSVLAGRGTGIDGRLLLADFEDYSMMQMEFGLGK